MTITLEAIRAAGGIVHSDGNIFFRDISMLQGLAVAATAAVAPQGDRQWICPTRTVADLVNNLLTMDQALPIYGAQYIEIEGRRRAVAVPPTVSRERVKDGRWIGQGEELNAAVVWTRAEQPAAVAPQGKYPPLPKVGPIGYASVVDVESYAKSMSIGPHLPGVRDVALWTTDQMRAYFDLGRQPAAAPALEAPAAPARIVADALIRLDAIYREHAEADCDEPPRRPDWLTTALHLAAAAPQAPAAPAAFQQRVQPWLMECFGPVISADKQERNHRFLEEALETVQAAGCTASEAHQLVDYVFGRPVGELGQEVGGAMTTLAALCLANGIDMHAEADKELARVWTMVEKIRAKQAAKPKHSPLPAAPAAPVVVPAQGDPAALQQLADVLESGRSLIHTERKEAADALRLQATAANAAPAAPAEGEVLVEVIGLTGSGKSAICGEIEILCRALGLDVSWPDGDPEKNMTHAEWTAAIEAYKPRVRIVERNVPRQSNGGPAK